MDGTAPAGPDAVLNWKRNLVGSPMHSLLFTLVAHALLLLLLLLLLFPPSSYLFSSSSATASSSQISSYPSLSFWNEMVAVNNSNGSLCNRTLDWYCCVGTRNYLREWFRNHATFHQLKKSQRTELMAECHTSNSRHRFKESRPMLLTMLITMLISINKWRVRKRLQKESRIDYLRPISAATLRNGTY